MKLAPALAVLGLLLGAALSPPALSKDKKPVRPQTRQTQVISPVVYKDLEAAQKALDTKDYAAAVAALDKVKARGDKLNGYERATLFNLYAGIHHARDQTPAAIDAYREVLKTPNLPEGLRDSTLFALAQMYFISEDYAKAITVLNHWFEVVAEPAPDAYQLLAQAHYQRQEYDKAERALIEALKLARARNQPPKEAWLGLLRAVYYELGDYPKASKVLEILVAQYPSESYYLQLSGMYGLMGKQKAQLATLHAAYQGGMVSKKGDLLNLARLYMVENAPYPAVRLLDKAIADKIVEQDAEVLQLQAQALGMAQESEAQVPILSRLAQMTGDARHYTFLGQAYSEQGKWREAIEAFESALRGKSLSDAASVRMQLGTALFNAGRLNEARRTFIAASDSQKHGESAASWVKFLDGEIDRREVIDDTRNPTAERPQTQSESAHDVATPQAARPDSTVDARTEQG